MDKNQQSFLKSFRRIVRFYNNKKDTIDSVSEVVSPEIDVLKTLVVDIDILAVQADSQTKEITLSKEMTKDLLSSCCLQLNNGLWLYATRVLNDPNVANKVAYTKTDLATTDEMLPVRAKAILEVADLYIPPIVGLTPEEPNPAQPVNPVKKYGATPELVKKTRETLASFEHKSPQARDVEKDVKGVNEILDGKFKLAKESVSTLELMFSAGFLTNDPVLYDSWLRASRPDDPRTMHTRIGGVVKDAVTGLGVRYVKVIDKETGDKTKSVKGGTYSLRVPLGTYTVEFSKNGYQTTQTEVIVEEEGKKTRLDVMFIPVGATAQ